MDLKPTNLSLRPHENVSPPPPPSFRSSAALPPPPPPEEDKPRLFRPSTTSGSSQKGGPISGLQPAASTSIEPAANNIHHRIAAGRTQPNPATSANVLSSSQSKIYSQVEKICATKPGLIPSEVLAQLGYTSLLAQVIF